MAEGSLTAPSENSVLDLAAGLGVRAQLILDALTALGLEVTDPTEPLDPLLEEKVVARMVESGQLASRALKAYRKKKREHHASLADEKLLKEALGASLEGYSAKALPPELAVLENQPKPSLLERLGLRRRMPPEPLLGEPLSTRTSPTESGEQEPISVPRPLVTSTSPASEATDLADLDSSERTPAETEPGAGLPREVVEPGGTQREVPSRGEEELGEQVGPAPREGLAQQEPERPGKEGVPEEIDVGDLDVSGEGEEEFAGLDESALEELLEQGGEEETVLDKLGDLRIDDLSTTPEPEPTQAAPEEPTEEKAVEEPEQEQEEQEEPKEAPEEEEIPLSLFERIVLRLDLSPAEMIAAAVASLVVMVTALGLTVYYYLNYSPQKAEELFKKGYAAYQYDLETLGEERFKTVVDSFTRLLTTFPDDPNLEEAAYLLAKAFYRRAEEVAATDPGAARNLYAETVDYFEKFLRQQKRISDRRAKRGLSPYMRIDWEEDARYHIALAHEKQKQFEQALQACETFLEYFPKSALAPRVRIKLGEIYRDWAGVDENLRGRRLQKAIEKFKEALQDPSCSPELRVALHCAIADINQMLYETTKEQYRLKYLQTALEQYREAQRWFAGTSGREPDRVNLERDLALGLADALLMLGRESAALVRSMTGATALYYPRSDDLREILATAAENEEKTATRCLLEAAHYYHKLLGESPPAELVAGDLGQATGQLLDLAGGGPVLAYDQAMRVKMNLAEVYFQLGKYNETIRIASPVVQELRSQDPDNELLGPLCYLIGDAAWELGEYDRLVLEYYSLARQYLPFYPEGTGERTNEAALKMANVYYSRGMRAGDPGYLKSAIDEYNRILAQFPDTNWTYFTRYWLARTYERYADVLSDPNSPVYSPKEAKKNYRHAYTQYNLALEARTRSAYVDKKHQDAMKECYFRTGRCAYKAGDLEQARKHLAEAIIWSSTAAPGDPRAIPCRELLGDIYLELGHPDQAVRIYQNYLDKKYQVYDENGDSFARVSIKLASACLRRFSYEQARQVLRRVARDNPVLHKPGSKEVQEGPGLQAQRLLAQSYRQEADASFDDQRRQALLAGIAEYEKLLAMNPSENDALRALGEMHFELAGPQQLDHYSKAAQYFKQYVETGAAEARPDRDVIYYRWGDCYYQLGDYSSAVVPLAKIIGTTIPPDRYARSLLILGECYQKLSDRQSADPDKQYYLQMAKQTYQAAINQNDPFVAQVARNRITMLSLPAG